MYRLPVFEEPEKQEFNTANALLEKSTPSLYLADDDFDFYKAREGVNKMQSDFLDWQSAQTKEDKDGTESEKEYDQWYSNEKMHLSKDMSDNQRTHFERMAENQDSVQRPWAQNYQKEQRKSYGIKTHNSVLETNKAALAANMHDDNFVGDSFAQIITSSNELARLQGLGEKESAELRINNVNDAIKSALQGKIDAEDWESASALYKRNGHFLTSANQNEIKNNIQTLHSRAQARKTIDGASNKLLQMDENTATALLKDNTWLQSMNISEQMLPELVEMNAMQRQNTNREKKSAKDAQEVIWFDKVVTANAKNPSEALHIVQERKDLAPELRSSMVDAINNGRINTNDDIRTMLSLQDRIFGDAPDIENSEFAQEVGKGNLKISTAQQLTQMQQNLNKGEKNLVRNALNVLDSSFEGVEDFAQNPNRLAARNVYLKSLTKAIADNDTGQLVQLTNKEHVQSVGQSFSAGNVGIAPIFNGQNVPQEQTLFEKFHGALQDALGLLDEPDTSAPSTWQNIKNYLMSIKGHNPIPEPLGLSYNTHEKPASPPEGQEEEGVILMERPLDIEKGESLYDFARIFRHEEFFPLGNGDSFGLSKEGEGVSSDNPKHYPKYTQKDTRVFKKKYIDMAKAELEKDGVYQDMITEFMANHATIGEDMDASAASYNLFYKNCQQYTNAIIERAEKIAKSFSDELYIK